MQNRFALMDADEQNGTVIPTRTLAGNRFAELDNNSDQQQSAIPAAPEGSEGFLGGVADFGRGIGHAAVASGPIMAGQALQRLDIDGGNEFVSDIGKDIEEWGEKNDAAIPSLQESIKSREAREESPWNARGWGYGAGESLVQSVAPVATVAAGAAAVGAAPIVAAGAGIATVGALFYGSNAEDTYRRAIDAGVSEEDAMEVSRLTGAIEGGGEMVADMIPLRLFKVMAKPVKGAIVKSVLAKKGMKQATKDILNTVFAEEVTEIGQSAGQAYVEGEYGVRDPDIVGEIKDVIGPTMIVSALFGAGGVAGGGYRRNKITRALEDTNAKPEEKEQAIATVYAEVKKLDEQLADKFLKRALFLKNNDRPIILSNDSKYMKQVAGQNIGPITAVSADIDITTGGAIPSEEETAAATVQADVDMTVPDQDNGVEVSESWNQILSDGEKLVTESGYIEMTVDDKKLSADEIDTLMTEAGAASAMAIPSQADLIQQGADEAALSPNNDLSEPTTRQKETGKYKKGPIPKEATPLGMRMMIENPAESTRSGTDEDGNEWSQTMQNHYGYVVGMEGFDKDKLDVFFGPDAATSETVHVIDQYNQAGEFDEHKVILGAADEADAHDIYHANYHEGWNGAGAVTTMTVEEFKGWGKSGEATKGALVPMERSQIQEATNGNQEIDESSTETTAQRIEAGAEERDGATEQGGELSEEVTAKGLNLSDSFEYDGMTYELFEIDGDGIHAEEVSSGAVTTWNDAEEFTAATGIAISGLNSAKETQESEQHISAMEDDNGDISDKVDARGGDDIIKASERPDSVSEEAAPKIDTGRMFTEFTGKSRGKNVFKLSRPGSSMTGTLSQIVDELEAGEHGRKNFDYDENGQGGTPKVTGIPSTYPAYFRNLGLTAKDINKWIGTLLAGGSLTEIQSQHVAIVVEGKRAEQNDQALAYRAEVIKARRDVLPEFMSDDEVFGTDKDTFDAVKYLVETFAIDDTVADDLVERAAIHAASDADFKQLIDKLGQEHSDGQKRSVKKAGQPTAGEAQKSVETSDAENSGNKGEGTSQEVTLSDGDQTKMFATPSKFGTKTPKGKAATNDDMHFNDLQEEDKQGGLFGGETVSSDKSVTPTQENQSTLPTLTEEGRRTDGKPIMPGDVFLTAIGRKTTPYPKYSTKRTTKADEARMNQWLIDNYREEAVARGDDFNQTLAKGLDAKNFSQADSEAAHLYLFGESQPAVPKSITKPLVSHEAEDVVSQEKTVAPKRTGAQENIEDLGEKIGGARKDKEVKTATNGKAKADKPTGWRSRYRVTYIEKTAGRLQDRHGDKWAIFDNRKKEKWGIPRSLGNKYFDTEAEALAALPALAVAEKHRLGMTSDKKYTIFRTIGDRKRVQATAETFETRDEAMRYLATNAEALLETRLSFGEEVLLKPAQVFRTGAERRKGDVQGDTFMSAFGFRGVEFGNWLTKGEERQEVMNHAYDALLDMAEVLGIPAKAVSLNGDLALAFGARGHGLSGAAAHYEPNYAVINLTKMAGAGSLAHEWFHALDHYVGRLDGKAKSEKTTTAKGDKVYPDQKHEQQFGTHGFRYRSDARNEIETAYTDFVKTMLNKGETFVEDTLQAEKFVRSSRDALASKLKEIRDGLATQLDPKYWKRKNKPATEEQLARFDVLTKRLVDGEALEVEVKMLTKGRNWSSYSTNDVLDELSAIYKAVRGRAGRSESGDNRIGSLVGPMNHYARRIKTLNSANNGDKKRRSVPTAFRMQAIAADQARATDYWSSPHELAARSFAAYMEDKLAEREAGNDFLAYHAHGAVMVPVYPDGLFRPYPEGKERKAINEAFDKLFSEFKTKETDNGVALYSKKQVKDENAKFSAEIDKALSGKLSGRYAIKVGETPNVLQRLGARPVRLVIQAETVKKVVGGKHTLTADQMKTLPELLHDPVAVFDSSTQEGSYVVLTEMEHDGKPVVAAIHVNVKVGTMEVNRVASLYTKDKINPMLGWVESGKLRYLNTQKSPEWLVSGWLQLPAEPTKRGSTKLSILTENDFVNYSRTQQATGTTTAQVEKEVKSLLGKGFDKLTKAGKLRIVQSVKDLPQQLRNGLAMVAWHGTPHAVDKFNSDKIGTGEGAQAYGHGLYFAGKKEVAEHYRETLSSRGNLSGRRSKAIYYKGEQLAPSTYGSPEKTAAFYVAEYGRDSAESMLQYDGENSAIEYIDKIQDRDLRTEKLGNLYQVELAPGEEEYLLWDKPLSEQSTKVKGILGDVANIDDKKAELQKDFDKVALSNDEVVEHIRIENALARGRGEATREDVKVNKEVYRPRQDKADKIMWEIKRLDHQTGQDAYLSFADQFGSDKEASKYLHSLGIRGVRYLDGTSRGKGEGDTNYVIFNDADIQITALYSKNGDIAGYYKDGQVTLIADNIHQGQAADVMLHEGLHMLMREDVFFVKDRAKILTQFAALRSKSRIVQEAFDRVPEDTKRAYRDEEAFAYFIESNPKHTFVRRMIAAVRAWLLRHGIPVKKLTEADLMALVKQGVKSFANRTGKESLTVGEVALASKNAKIPATIMVSGIERPTTNSEGDLIHATKEGIENFWKWFDRAGVAQSGRDNIRQRGVDSQDQGDQNNQRAGGTSRTASRGALSERGNPVVFYHATKNDFTVFDLDYKEKQDFGWLGKGVYLANSEAGARSAIRKTVGKEVSKIMPLYAAVKNPYLAPKGFKISMSKLTQNEVVAVTKQLKSFGHDGVMMIHPTGDIELVAFDPNQVKSSTGNTGDFSLGNDDTRFSRLKAPSFSAKETQEMGMLRTASIQDRRLMVGGIGTTHYDVRQEIANESGVKNGTGFVTPDGTYLTRKDALEWVKTKKPAAYRKLSAETKANGLESQDYANAEGVRSDVDDEMNNFISKQFGVSPHLLFSKRAPVGDAYKQAAPKVKNTIDYLRMKFQDKFIPLLRAQEKLEAEGWEKTNENDAYRAEELFHGKATKRLEDFYDTTVQPLLNQIDASSEVTLAELEDYLYAKFAPERNAHIAEINKEMPESGSGMSDETAQNILDTFATEGKIATLEELEKEVRKITQMQRDIIRNEGLELDETMDNWEFNNDNYIPLKSAEEKKGMGIGTGHNVKRSGTKQALGRRSRATNLLAHLFEQTGATIVRAEKAVVGRAFLQMAEENAESNLFAVHNQIPTTRAKVGGKVRNVPDGGFTQRENVLTVTRENGTLAYVEMFDDDLARVMKNLTPGQYGKVTQALAKATRFLSMMNTSLNPEFIVTNFTRDIQTAMVHLSGEQSAKLAKDVFKGIPGALKGIRSTLRGNGSGEWAEWYERFQKAGAQVSFMDLRGMDDWQRKLSNVARGDGLVGSSHKAINSVFETISDYNTIVENATRLAAFRKSVESGMSESDAASLAKNLTVNFNRKGELGPAMNALYMFANAGIQGSTRILGAMKSKRVQKMMGATVLMAWGLAELGRASGGEDDDGEARWDKVEDYVKQNNLIFINSEGERTTIRLPYGYNWFVALGYTLSDLMHGKDVGKSAHFITTAFLNAFNPLGGAEGILKIISPTLIDPLVEIATNENFMGTKIKPENFQFGAQKPESQLFFRNASEPSKAVAEALNAMTGGSKYDSGIIDVSPELMDHFFDFFVGGAGRTVKRIADAPFKYAEGTLQPNQVPFLRQWRGQQSTHVDNERFYDNLTNIENARSAIKELPGTARSQYRATHPEYKLRVLASKQRSTMSMLRKKYYSALDAGSTSEAQRIQDRMTGIAKKFNKRYNDVTR